MGIKGVWEVLGEGEVWPITDYAAQHFAQRKRPLRIAIDEACWRFTNLTPEQVKKIQDGEPAANPVEKVILWRTLRLLKLNCQLLFVIDGMRRPWKRGKHGGNKLDEELVKLTHRLLDRLQVPYHRAPGEAEAECAKLQAEGIVDAVWSDDSDALMFGCGTLIRQHKVDGKIVKDHIRVYRAESILQKHDLDADSLVMFAALAGGDYNEEGLRGCGPKTAALLAQRQNGLARALCHTSQNDLATWRSGSSEAARPTVSSHEQLHNLRGLKNGWDQRIDQVKLRVMLRERFNFSTREYLKHISPIFLTRAMARASHEQRSKNIAFDVELKRTRSKKNESGEAPPKSEVKIMFSPMPVVQDEIDLSRCPPDEDWAKFAAKDGTPYDPTQSIECEILHCFLRNGLSEAGLDLIGATVKPAKRKRKAGEAARDSSTPAKKPRILTTKTTSSADLSSNTAMSTNDLPGSDKVAKQRGRPKKGVGPGAATLAKTSRKKTKKSSLPQESAAKSRSPPRPTFTLPRAMPRLEATVVNLCADDGDADSIDLQLDGPGPWSSQSLVPNGERINDKAVSVESPELVPGDIISADVLRSLRANSSLLRSPAQALPVVPPALGPHTSPPVRSAVPEVIDLT